MAQDVSKVQDSAPSSPPVEQRLFTESFDTMVQWFNSKNEKKVDSGSTGSDSATAPIAETADGAEDKNALNDGSKKITDKEPTMKFKDGDYRRLQANIREADEALATMPTLDKQIAKLDLQWQQIAERRQELEQSMRDAANKSFSKEDRRAFGELGQDQLTGQPLRRGFDVNPQQRAWLREHHPDIYKMLEKHDKAHLDAANNNALRTDLVQTRDRPITARLELAQHEHSIGANDLAIRTLTDLIHTRPSVLTDPSMGDFRQLAIDTGAAFDRSFRKAVEMNGGNILDFVIRPNLHERNIGPVPKGGWREPPTRSPKQIL